MTKRALLLFAVVGVYVWISRKREVLVKPNDLAAEAEWANEGGANASESV